MIAGGIDGSVTPELIPDSTAYRLFMNAVAEPAGATPEQIARQRAKLSRAFLSEADLNQVFPIFANYQQQRQNLTQTYQTASALRTTQAYESQRDAITTATVAQLKAALSADGMTRLEDLIQGEKRHMTIAPFPNMP